MARNNQNVSCVFVLTYVAVCTLISNFANLSEVFEKEMYLAWFQTRLNIVGLKRNHFMYTVVPLGE